MKSFAVGGMAAFMVLLIVGCPHDKYVLELSADKDHVVRKLTVVGVEKEVSAETLTRVGAAYGKAAAAAPAAQATFEGRFAGATPDDVGGGNGMYLHLGSTLGAMYGYAESFRGNDAAAALVEERLAAADQLVDLVRGWFRREFAAVEGFAQLDALLAGDLRRDFRDFVMYGSGGLAADEHPYRMLPSPPRPPGQEAAPESKNEAPEKTRLTEATQRECVVRTVLYLARHGYVSPDVLTAFLRSSPWESHGLPQEATPFLAAVLKAKAGVANPEPLARAIVELISQGARAERSMLQYLLTTEQGKALARDHGYDPAAGGEVPEELKKECLDLVGAKLERLALGSLALVSGTDDELEVSFAVPVEPLETNGVWDKEARVVRWAGEIQPFEPGGRYRRLPVVCYVAWVAPNGAEQQALFGKVALAGSELSEYIAWVNGLPPARAEAWNRMLSSLKPGDTAALRAFRFEGDAAPAVSAHTGAGALFRAVTGEEPPAAPE